MESSMFGPMHPVTRLGRLAQQWRAFAELHATELDALAGELEAAGLGELAKRLRAFRELHGREAGMVLEELADIREQLQGEGAAAGTSEMSPSDDPGAASPKRAAWLARREAEPKPISRREFLIRSRGPD